MPLEKINEFDEIASKYGVKNEKVKENIAKKVNFMAPVD